MRKFIMSLSHCNNISPEEMDAGPATQPDENEYTPNITTSHRPILRRCNAQKYYDDSSDEYEKSTQLPDKRKHDESSDEDESDIQYHSKRPYVQEQRTTSPTNDDHAPSSLDSNKKDLIKAIAKLHLYNASDATRSVELVEALGNHTTEDNVDL